MGVRGKAAERGTASKAKTKATASEGETKAKTKTLNDDESRMLATTHVGKYERLLAAKKTADADLRNYCKTIRSDLGESGVDIVKAMIELTSPEGEHKVRARLAAQAKAAAWRGLPVGTQILLDLESPDRTPAADRAYDEGKQASMENQPCKPPYAPELEQYRRWMDGYNDHQAVLAGKIGRGNPKATDDDEKDLRPRFLQQRDAEREAEKEIETTH